MAFKGWTGVSRSSATGHRVECSARCCPRAHRCCEDCCHPSSYSTHCLSNTGHKEMTRGIMVAIPANFSTLWCHKRIRLFDLIYAEPKKKDSNYYSLLVEPIIRLSKVTKQTKQCVCPTIMEWSSCISFPARIDLSLSTVAISLTMQIYCDVITATMTCHTVIF